MFRRLRNKKLDQLTKSLETYIDFNYKETPKTHKEELKPVQESCIKYSIDSIEDEPQIIQPEHNHVQYQRRTPVTEPVTTYRNVGVKYSLRDNYDSDTIQNAMKKFASTDSAGNTLQTLEESTDISFVDKMLEHINRKHLRDSEVYKAAQVDRRLFSKMVSDRTYKPAKDTCIALCLAMKLTLSEANDLLSRAGYTLSHSSKRDVILEYFFREQFYKIIDINEVLYRLDQKVLGRT